MNGVEAEKIPVVVVKSTGGAQYHDRVTDGLAFSR